MRISELICLKLADWFRKRNLLDAFYEKDEISEEVYYEFLYKDAERSYNYFKDVISFDRKEILDVGCGLGAKTAYFVSRGAKEVTGTDVDREILLKAEEWIRRYHPTLSDRVKFEQCKERTLPFPSESFDIIMMDSVFEHLSYPETILNECWRVVRKNGYVCIDFQPWWGPHGPHVDNLIPIPWSHLFFSERTLVHVCAEIYDSDKYRRAFWDFEEGSRKKRPNKWKNSNSRLPDLNKMTIRRFQRIIKNNGYQIVYYKRHGYEDSHRRYARKIGRLLKIPFSLYPLNEVFTSCMVCIVKK